jgi:hypothetical protein
MTTPLEAQELAKRLRDALEPFVNWHVLEAYEDRDPVDCWFKAGDFRRAHAAHREAAAFLEHPVNTGQGVEAGIFDPNCDCPKCRGRAALATRPPLASVEGAWCPDWTPSDQDKTAVALTLALSKHIPDWPGATDDQLADVAKAVLSALAQSGRSSAEPVAWQTHPDQTSPMTVERERFEDTVETVERPIRERQAETLGPEDGGVTAGETAPFPPVGPQEAAAVKPLQWVKPPLSETLSKAETILGDYKVWTHFEAGGKWFWSDGQGFEGDASSEGAAKAAAWERLRRERAGFAIDANFQALRKIEAIEGEADVRRALEAAEARLATVEKALRPFASIGEMIAEHGVASDDQRVEESVYTVALDQVMKLTLGDFRRAHEALASLSTNAVREGE